MLTLLNFNLHGRNIISMLLYIKKNGLNVEHINYWGRHSIRPHTQG